MNVLAVQHINIATLRLEETRAFFVEAFGLAEGPRPPFSSAGYWLYAGDLAVVHIQQSEEARLAPSSESALNHAAFQVADFDAAVARLERHGVALEIRTVPGSSLRQAFLLDPNGVRLEINETEELRKARR